MKLQDIAQKLPQFPDSMDSSCKEIQRNRMTKGESIGLCLLFIEDIISAAQRYNSSGCEFPRHAHQEKEWLIVYRGEMILELNGTTRHLKAGDYAVIEPETPHRATFPMDCWYLAITVPSSEAFPRGTNK